MTAHGRINLLAMFLLPIAASIAALLVFGTRSETLVTVFALNLVPMLIATPVAGLLLRGSRRAGGRGRNIALWPSVIPAVLGAVGYLWYAVMPDGQAPGFEYIAGPQYLLILVIVLSIVAWIGVRVVRSR